jgi:hypothetical protein
VHLGVRTGADPSLNVRKVIEVEWNHDFTAVRVGLSDLDEHWLRANFREFAEAGWMIPPGAVG